MSTTSDHPLERGLHELREDLRRDLALMAEANAELRKAEGTALRSYTEAVDEVIGSLERDLAEQSAALEAERKERAGELRAEWDDLVRQAHELVDRLRVQEHLAELEVRDQLMPRWESLATAMDRLRTTLREAITPR